MSVITENIFTNQLLSLVVVVNIVIFIIVFLLQGLSECSSADCETNDTELELWQESRLMVCLYKSFCGLTPLVCGRRVDLWSVYISLSVI